MFIQKIKDNSQGIVAKIIVGLIAVTFAAFGIDALVQVGTADPDAAVVNGEGVSRTRLQNMIERQKQRLLEQMGASANPDLLDDALIREQVLNGLIDRELLQQSTEALSLQVSDGHVNREIYGIEAFQEAGSFSRDRFNSLLRNQGLRPLDFKNDLRSDLIISQPLQALVQSAFVTGREIGQFSALERQTRNIAYLTVPAASFVDADKVEDSAIKAYYEDNKSALMTDEQVELNYIELKLEDFLAAAEASEKEIQAAYQERVEEAQGNEQRRAAHILVEINDETNKAEAQLIIDQISTKLAAGESFADLAKTFSQDPGSANNGGDLGFAAKGAYVKPFEEALFAMQEGEMSEVVESTFGLHIIKLVAIKAAEIPSFDSLKDELSDAVRRQNARGPFDDAYIQLEDQSYSASDLEDPADFLNLKVGTTGLFSRNGGEGIASNQQVINAAFSDLVLTERNNSRPIEITPDHYLVVHVKQYEPAKFKPLEKVTDSIRQTLAQNDAHKAAQATGERILAELGTGDAPEAITETHGYEWSIVDKLKRVQSEVNDEIVAKAFSIGKPKNEGRSVGGLQTESGDYVAIILTKVYEGAPDDLNTREKEVLARLISNQVGNRDFSEYRQGLKESADIERL